MAITNITGQKPKPIVEVNTLDQALSKKFANANAQRAELVSAIKDIMLQYKNNFNLEQDERNVKIVDCILKRHEALLNKMLTDDGQLQNILSALDLNIESWLSRFYLLSKPGTGPDDVRTIKENIVQCVLEALSKYSGKDIVAITSNTVVNNKIVDKNENIDNYDALSNYFNNVQTFMQTLYKSRLTIVKNTTKVEMKQQKNLLIRLTASTKQKISSFSNKGKIGAIKSKLFDRFNKPLTKKDRQPKKNLNPFRSVDFIKRIGLNKSLKKGLKRLLDISGIVVLKNVVGKIAKSILSKMKPLINSVKKVINKIKSVIIGFVVSLIPFVGPIIKIVKFVLKPIIFTLKIAFKLLTFAIKFIGKSIKFIFTGAFKIMKGIIKGITGVISGLTNGIYKILKSNIVKKIVKFMLTPTGAFITGYIVGLLYLKLWKPFKEKYAEIKKSFFGEKEESMTLKEKLFKIKDFVFEKYNMLKNKLTLFIDKFWNFLSKINSKTLKQGWIVFKIQVIKPLKQAWAMIKEMFLTGLSCLLGGSGLGSLIKKGLSAVLAPFTGPLAPPLADSIVSIGSYLLGKFLGTEKEDGRGERDEIEQRHQDLLQLYGPNSLDKQEEYKNLIDSATTNGISEETKEAIRQKQETYRQIGITTEEERDDVDKLKAQVNEEISICSNNAKYTVDDVKNNKDGILENAYNTKIPFATERNGEGKVTSVSDELQIPNNFNPYGFRLIRAKLIDDQIDRFYKGLITYDQLMEFKNSIVERDDDGKMHISKELLESEQKSSGLDLQAVLTNNESGSTWLSLGLNKNATEKMDSWLNSTASAEKAQQEYQAKIARINNILNGLAATGAFSGIPKEKLSEVIENFRQYLLKQDLNAFEKLSSSDKAKYLMDIYEKIAKDVDVLINKDLQKKEDEENQKELAEAGIDEPTSMQLPNPNVQSQQNTQTATAIQQTPMPTESIKTEDNKAIKDVEEEVKAIDAESDAKALDSNKQTTDEVNNTQGKLRNIINKLTAQLKRLSHKDQNTMLLANDKNANPAAEEVKHIMSEQIQ